VQREHGQATAEEVEHGLSLLREYANMRACYWICPFCPTPEGAPRHFTAAKDFLTHVDACHEGVQMTEDGLPCTCVGCNCEVRARAPWADTRAHGLSQDPQLGNDLGQSWVLCCQLRGPCPCAFGAFSPSSPKNCPYHMCQRSLSICACISSRR
jgi:hypothetical protein